VVAVAVVVRVLYFAAYCHSAFFVSPILDSAAHDELARTLAAGNWAAGAPYFRPPLFPWLLGLLYAVGGAGPWPGRMLNATAGVVLALGIWVAGGRLGFGRRGRLAAALAMALWPVELFLEGELLGAPVATALATWGMVLMLRRGGSREASHEAGAGSCLGAGALWGLAALARAPLALLPLGGAVLAVLRPGGRVLRVAAVVGGAALVWAGPAALMASHGAGFRFPSLQGGINFYAGNHPGADGRSVTIPGLESAHGWREFEAASRRGIPASATGRPAPVAADRAWWDRGWSFWRDHPGEALTLTARRALYLVHGYEAPNNRSLYAARGDAFLPLVRLPWAYWPFGLLAPLALLGAWSVRQRRAWRPVLLQALLVGLPLLVFFVNARFRLPAVPPLLLLAVPGFLLLRRGSPRSWAAFALLYLLANAPWPGAIREDPAREALARGEANLGAGRLETARAAYRESLRLDPAEGRAELGLAVVAERENRPREAARAFAAADSLGLSGYWALEAAWAGFLDRQGHPEEALSHLERAVADFPESADLRGRLGLALEALGRTGEAEAALASAAARGSRSAEVWNSLGRFRYLAGDGEGARIAWDRALSLDPDHFKARYNRGLWFASRGEVEPARRDLEVALRTAPNETDRERVRHALELLPSGLP